MDEPLSNLDAKLRVEMRTEIRDLQRALGTTTVYVTHDQEEALVISDRIAVMRAGVVRQVGRPWEIYKDPADEFVASFVGTTNLLDGELSESAGGAAEVRVGSSRIPLERRPPGATKVRVAFRPEELTLSPGQCSPGPGEGCLAGRVRTSTFTGSLVSYAVDCADGVNVAVERHRPGRADILPPATEVTVRIPRSAIYLFHPETGARL
jgi:iron(III) transport system ATP-binding protein